MGIKAASLPADPGRLIENDEAKRAPAGDPDDAAQDSAALPDVRSYMVAGGEWTRQGARKFLADCPKVAVSIPRDELNDKKGRDSYAEIGWNGFSYPVLKGKVVMVPSPIAAIIEESQRDFRTTQAQNMAHLITDIGDGEGPEIMLAR